MKIESEKNDASSAEVGLLPGPRIVRARRTCVSIFLNIFACCTWIFWPLAFRKPTVAGLRALAGLPRLIDPFSDRDAFDLFYERQLELCRARSAGHNRLSNLGVLVVAVQAWYNIRVRKWLANAPPPAPVAHRKRVFIAGPFRTGTTLLQRVLAVNRACKSFSLREFKNPITANLHPSAGLLKIVRLLAPHLLSIHPMAIDEPEECIFVLTQSVPLMNLLPVNAPCVDWHADLLPHMPVVYNEYSNVLQRLVALYTKPEHTHLILKCPVHGYFVEALHSATTAAAAAAATAAMPAAKQAMTSCIAPPTSSAEEESSYFAGSYFLLRTYRRDIAKVAASFASLSRAMLDVIMLEIDLNAVEETAVQAVLMQVAQMRRINEIARVDTRMQVIDVDFDDLVKQPAATVEALCQRLGLPFDEEATAAVLAQAERSRKQKDAYASYHGWELSPRSLEALKACQQEMATLVAPLKV